MRTLPLIFSLGSLGCTPADNASWTTDPAEPSTGEDSTEFEEEGDGEGEWEDEEIVNQKVLWGYQEGQEALTGLYYADPDQGGVLCEVFFLIDDRVTTDACEACTEAWTVTRGEGLIDINVDGACEAEGWNNLWGSSYGIGYVEEQLWADLGQGWKAYDNGQGEFEDGLLLFELSLL